MSYAEKLNPKSDHRSTQPPPFDGKWRWTECIGCPAAPLHRAIGCPTNGFSSETLALFYEGILHEDDLKSRLRAIGLEIEDFPDGVDMPGYPIVGHPDGRVLFEVLETKSFSDDSDTHNFLAKHPSYKKQVLGYMKMLGSPQARVIAKHRMTGWILDDIVVYRDDDFIKPYLDNVLAVAGLVDSGISTCEVPWAPQCSHDFLTRLFCPYNGTHCQRTQADAVPELDTLLQDYAPRKIVLDKFVAEMDIIRAQVIGIMKEAGLRNVAALDGTTARVQNGRKGINVNYDLASKYLSKEQYKEVFTDTQGNDFVVITPAKEYRQLGDSSA